jgi:hypothetical protein
LSGGLQIAEIAESVLNNVSREIQAQGWHCNTRRNIELTKNVDNKFALGVDTLKCDTVNPRSRRANNTPAPSRFINASLRKAQDGTKYLMYDVDNDSETWGTDVTTLTVDLIQFIEFDALTPLLQTYVFRSAAHRFQKAMIGAKILSEFTTEDVQIAMANAIQEDMDNEDNNMLHDNRDSQNIVYRYNPIYGY